MSIGIKMSNLMRSISARHVVVALFLVATVVSLLGADFSGSLRNAIHPVLATAGDAGMYATIWVKNRVDRAAEKPVTPEDYHKKEEQLRIANRTIQVLLTQNHAQEKQLSDLKPLYRRSDSGYFPRDIIASRVLAADSLPYGHTLMISAGIKDGLGVKSPATTRILMTDRSKVIPSQPGAYLSAIELGKVSAVSYQFFVGEIVEAWAYGARLRLVTDRAFNRAVSIRRVVDHEKQLSPKTRREYIVIEKNNAIRKILSAQSPLVDVHIRGDGSKGMLATNVPLNHAIEKGDIVSTKDNDIFLPATVEIGIVEKVMPMPSKMGFVTLYIKPLADLSTLRDIYIIINEDPRGIR